MKPDYSALRVFGCACFVLLPKRERTKLTARSALCVFLGYGVEQKGYRCYDPVARKLRISRHLSFLECLPYFYIPTSSTMISKEDLVMLDPFSDSTSSEEPPLVLNETSSAPLTNLDSPQDIVSSTSVSSISQPDPSPMLCSGLLLLLKMLILLNLRLTAGTLSVFVNLLFVFVIITLVFLLHIDPFLLLFILFMSLSRIEKHLLFRIGSRPWTRS